MSRGRSFPLFVSFGGRSSGGGRDGGGGGRSSGRGRGPPSRGRGRGGNTLNASLFTFVIATIYLFSQNNAKTTCSVLDKTRPLRS